MVLINWRKESVKGILVVEVDDAILMQMSYFSFDILSQVFVETLAPINFL